MRISLRTLICCSFDLLAQICFMKLFCCVRFSFSFLIFLLICIKIDADKACCSWRQRSMPVVGDCCSSRFVFWPKLISPNCQFSVYSRLVRFCCGEIDFCSPISHIVTRLFVNKNYN